MTVNAPFNVYDIFGILFPGTLALLLASLFYPPLWSYVAGGGEWATAALVVVFAYIAGEVLSGLSRLTIGKLRDRADSWWKLSHEAEKTLVMQLGDDYLRGPSKKKLKRGRLELAHALVWNRTPDYPTFIARSDLNRSLSLLSGIATLTSLAAALGLPLSISLSTFQSLAFGATSALLGCLFFWRSKNSYERATGIVYCAALQHFAEKDASATRGASIPGS